PPIGCARRRSARSPPARRTNRRAPGKHKTETRRTHALLSGDAPAHVLKRYRRQLVGHMLHTSPRNMTMLQFGRWLSDSLERYPPGRSDTLCPRTEAFDVPSCPIESRRRVNQTRGRSLVLPPWGEEALVRE